MSRVLLAVSLLLLAGPPLLGGETPGVRSLRTQRVGDVTYFHVAFGRPKDSYYPEFPWDTRANGRFTHTGEALARRLGQLPRLVPQDDRTAAVYYRLPLPLPPAGDADFEFVGKVRARGAAHFLLFYPCRNAPGRDPAPEGTLESLGRGRPMAALKLKLKWKQARKVGRPDGERNRDEGPQQDDLEGLWAEAQALHFAVLEVQAPEFGFPGLARAATGRKYRVPARPLVDEEASAAMPNRRLYELTTGGAALTESLALRRFLDRRSGAPGRRYLAVKDLPAIDVAEHPWERMMAGKKPAPEPLAGLVPHDNYYVAFKGIRPLLDFGDLLDQWGGSLLNTFEVSSRDYATGRRYRKQLCLTDTGLARTLGPAVVRAVALTGSDPYLREGSDVSVIFRVTNRTLFRAATEPLVARAREEFGGRLKESKAEYRGVRIESFVTPRREVSLYRAAVEDYIIHSNSPVALRRILDTAAGRRKALADSLDFKYMRTVFRRDEKQEDGFAFLSDAFIRRLVGPAGKIKEKRRLEALSALTLATHGALFTAWETGRLPDSHKAMLAGSSLRPEELRVPEGKPVVWDGKAGQAVSEAYNTLAFATPLVELPIDDVTFEEWRDYRQFREDYLRLWRRYFDPVGMRLTLGEKRVRVETYILPLLESSRYNGLRRLTGDGVTRYDPARLPPGTVGQFLFRLPVAESEPVVGDWFAVHLDDGPAYRRWVELRMRRALDPEFKGTAEQERLFWQLPVTLGIGVKDADKFSRQMSASWERSPLAAGRPVASKYKGVTIKRAPINAKVYRQGIPLLKVIVQGQEEGEVLAGLIDYLPDHEAPAAVYQAVIDGGYYISWQEEPLRRRIDAAPARRKAGPGEEVAVNAALGVRPTPEKAAQAWQLWLEWQSQGRALSGSAAWEVLYRGGVTSGGDRRPGRDAVARLLGFLPVSPDGALFVFDTRRGEVTNTRHGSWSRPQFHDRPAADSPPGRLLGQLRGVRADLRFREDGVHTVLTIDREPPGKPD